MKNILITGPPGIGKTTLVKKIINQMKLLQIECEGFYTEEVRNDNTRVGFDIITLDGKRAVLARKLKVPNLPSVGQYSVYLDDFERLALPVFEKPEALLIVDEIGKMELFSKRFQDCIQKVMDNKNIRMVATVPLKAGPALIQHLKENPNCDVIMVNHSNRDHLVAEIVELLKTK